MVSVVLLEFGQTHEELVPPHSSGCQMLLVAGDQFAHLLHGGGKTREAVNAKVLVRLLGAINVDQFKKMYKNVMNF